MRLIWVYPFWHFHDKPVLWAFWMRDWKLNTWWNFWLFMVINDNLCVHFFRCVHKLLLFMWIALSVIPCSSTTSHFLCYPLSIISDTTYHLFSLTKCLIVAFCVIPLDFCSMYAVFIWKDIVSIAPHANSGWYTAAPIITNE